ncbi:MAG: ComEA family DNA-binding protein [Erysipelotrichaceae bacterium]|nr:ComEA family DNA-binding protein [Erysipelotrichaceae bacterium]
MRKHLNLLFKILSIVLSIGIIGYISYDIHNYPIEGSKEIHVEVRGEVKEEKIYTMEEGSNLSDLLELVELNDNADISGLSLQSVLYNDEIIVIPEKSEHHLISINSAGISELCTLPGIGPKTAQKIIEYREKTGSFLSLEEIMEVNGIGKAKFARIKEYITL